MSDLRSSRGGSSWDRPGAFKNAFNFRFDGHRRDTNLSSAACCCRKALQGHGHCIAAVNAFGTGQQCSRGCGCCQEWSEDGPSGFPTGRESGFLPRLGWDGWAPAASAPWNLKIRSPAFDGLDALVMLAATTDSKGHTRTQLRWAWQCAVLCCPAPRCEGACKHRNAMVPEMIPHLHMEHVRGQVEQVRCSALEQRT